MATGSSGGVDLSFNNSVMFVTDCVFVLWGGGQLSRSGGVCLDHKSEPARTNFGTGGDSNKTMALSFLNVSKMEKE